MSVIEKVAPGEEVRFNGLGPFTILDTCDSDAQGHWVCISHGKSFGNQMEKDGHIMRGTHRLAWICHQHGPEVP